MKKSFSTFLVLITLIALSVVTYIIQLIEFQDPRNTAFYFFQDMAFLPLQVALVTIVIGKIINTREKRERLKKTNMMLSTFFSEVGNDLLGCFYNLYAQKKELEVHVTVKETWAARDYRIAIQKIQSSVLSVNCSPNDLQNLKTLLSEKRYLILLMLQNPNLIEHDTFTDLLWAIFHLTDELVFRDHFDELPANDLNHLNIDIQRALKALLIHWISYLAHLQKNYPYLFSLELRKNSFGEKKSIIIY